MFSVLFYPSIGEDAIFSRGEGLIRIAKFNGDLLCLAGFQTDYDGGADDRGMELPFFTVPLLKPHSVSGASKKYFPA